MSINLDELEAQALAAVAAASNEDELEAARVSCLGRKSDLAKAAMFSALEVSPA